MEWKGVMPAVTTKFTSDDKLDLEMFSTNINAQLDAGVSAIILGGSLGEASTLSNEEKEQLVKHTVESCQGRVPVVMNIAERATKQAVTLAENAQKWGAEGLMLLPPMQYKATDYEVMAYFEAIAKSTDLPIMIYNNPVDYKIEVTLEMFERLLKLDNIKAVKESTRDISNVSRIKNSFGDACRYPYEYIHELQKTLASKHGVPVESIVITGGSNEALRVTGLAISSQGGNIVAGKPTYLALMSYAEVWGSKIKWVPVDSQKGYDLKKIKSSVDDETKMIFIANPNNPTGTLLNQQSLKDFCEEMSKKTIVFCDEAYYDYINEDNYPSMDYLIRKGENVIISRTFSKVYGLAGLRIGYLVLRPELADQLFGDYSVIRRPNIMAQTNVLAVSAASEALKDEDFYKFSLNKANEEKDKIYKLLDYLNLKYINSSTNFVFFESKKHINELSEQMLEKGVIVGRPFPPFYDWCRISTGTSEEVDVFMKAMLEVYG